MDHSERNPNVDAAAQVELFENVTESFPVFLKTNLFPVRVNRQWYKRYAGVLPKDERVLFQPFEEIRMRESEIAVKYFYGDLGVTGESGYCSDAFKETRRKSARRRLQILQGKAAELSDTDLRRSNEDDHGTTAKAIAGYLHKQARREAMPSPLQNTVVETVKFMLDHSKIRRIVAHNREGETVRDETTYDGVLQKKKGRGWNILHKDEVKRKLKEQYILIMRDSVVQQFQRAIRIVRTILRWVKRVKAMVDCQQMITQYFDPGAQGKQENMPEINTDKVVYDLSAHKKENIFNFPTSVLLTLTKYYGDRSRKEVLLAIKYMRKVRAFSTLPLDVQQKIAFTAWVSEVPANKMVIRQYQPAQTYYIVLSGKAIKTTLIGSPYFKHKSGFKILDTFKGDTVFGEEVLLNPGCRREYSVITSERSTLLTLNISDYQKCLLKDGADSEPEHLALLRRMAFMRKISQGEILQEAHDNIFMFYFVSGTVITKSVKESEFVYVVKAGSCRALIELPPPPTLPGILRNKQMQKKGSVHGEYSDTVGVIRKFTHETKPKEDRSGSMFLNHPVEMKGSHNLQIVEDFLRHEYRGTIVDQQKAEEQMTGILMRRENHQSEKRSTATVSFQDSRDDSAMEKAGSDARTSNMSGRKSSNRISQLSFRRSTLVAEELNTAIKAIAKTKEISQDGIHLPPLIENGKQRNSELRNGSQSLKDQGARKRGTNEMSRDRTLSDISEICPTNKSGLCYSKWKLHRKLERGDVIGDEWTNARNAVKPIYTEEDSALVSDGSEVILVRKELLYKNGIISFI